MCVCVCARVSECVYVCACLFCSDVLECNLLVSVFLTALAELLILFNACYSHTSSYMCLWGGGGGGGLY